MVDYEKDWYFVAAKVLLRDGDKLLLLHDTFGDWDIPGGRLRPQDFDTSFPDLIKRKMKEEVGSNVRYELGEQKVFFRVERKEAGLDGRTVRIFAVGFEATYLGGDIELGEYMQAYEWVNVHTVKPEDYLAGGWLQGVQEYLDQVRA